MTQTQHNENVCSQCDTNPAWWRAYQCTLTESLLFLCILLSVSNVDFVIKIQEIKVQETDDALFECVLTHPLTRITWTGKGSTLENGGKYSITVSDHKLIHRLRITDCKQLDKGIYSARAGTTSCSAWLVVEGNT